MKKRFSYLLSSMLCLVFYIHAEAKHCTDCPKDTALTTNNRGLFAENDVHKMSKEELNILVDLLFDFDTISLKLLEDIKIALAKFQSPSLQEGSVSGVAASILPASEFYSEWEAKALFPEADMLKLSGDTTITITLRGDDQGEYYHPFNGLLTSNFGWRDNKPHNGVDIDLNRGDKVSAAFDGMVRVAKYHGGFGNVVIIRHYNGLETVYAHLSKLKVKPGQVVIAGQIVGLGGSTGHSTGTHLHFEVRFKGVPINPRYIISFHSQRLRFDEVTIKKTKWGLVAYPRDIKTYTVEKGDTLLGLAKQFCTTTTVIKQMNNFTGNVRLKEGQVINLALY